MKIYTKTGDQGETGLLGEARVSKTNSIIESIGAVDELNSALGVVASAADESFADKIHTIQSRLFDVGAELAQAREIERQIRSVHEEDIAELEVSIDEMDGVLQPLRNFILPGGCELASRLHVARSVCRRAEREVLRLHEDAGLRTELLVYLNRLSDWLFVAARWANHASQIDDIIWQTKP